MHSLSRLTPYKRKELHKKYTERMGETKGKGKEEFYKEISLRYGIHYNTVRKVCKRGRYYDFEDHPNKKAITLAAFMKRAYLWFQKKGIIIKKLLSDNGKEFTTHHEISRPKHSFEILLKNLGITHKCTRIRRPQTNSKVERFWRILNEEFLRKYTFSSWKDCNIKMKDWMVYYNTKRQHGGIQGMTPLEKFEKLLLENNICL